MSLWTGYGVYRALEQSNAAQESASDARRSSRDAVHRVNDLENDVQRLLLITQALWTIVQDELNLTDDQLAERVREIDLSDGRLDGKVRQDIQNCPQCGRSMSRRHRRCLFCGTDAPGGPFG